MFYSLERRVFAPFHNKMIEISQSELEPPFIIKLNKSEGYTNNISY